MLKHMIYYFSGTGNTWWVANEIQKQFMNKNHAVECHSIETLSTADLQDQVRNTEHIIIGFPVYGSTAPKIMRDFIQGFPAAEKQQSVSIFATQALASGDTAYYISRMFAEKGYQVRHAMHFRMMNNLHIPKFKFYKPKNDHRLDKLLHSTVSKVERFAEAIINEQTLIKGNNPPAHLLGNVQRRFIDQLVAAASKEFSINKDRCVSCGLCEQICPARNIQRSAGTYKFGSHCILCMRCYSQCPREAILIGEGSKDTAKYPRFKGPGKDFDIHRLMK